MSAMRVRTTSAAMIAAAIALAFAAPAAFAADQMSTSHDSGSSAMAPAKNKGSAMSGSMAHSASGSMSGGSTGGDNAKSQDKMSR
jgi:hypothetical protein